MAEEGSSSSIRVLVTGASGYLGQFLLDAIQVHNARKEEVDIVCAGTFGSRAGGIPTNVTGIHMDMQSASSMHKAIGEFRPDVVVNLAAMSSPAVCEKQKEEADAINVPTALLDALQEVRSDALFIQVSTDQIFDGQNPVYDEESEAVPVNQYGKSKLRFEQILRERWANHLILRSSLIYGPKPPRECARAGSFLQFLDESLATATEQEPVSLFEDEVRCPIYVHDVVAILLAFIRHAKECTSAPLARTLCMGGPERLSRVTMGELVSSLRGFPSSRIKPVKRADLQLGFTSPLDISMNSDKVTSMAWVREALPQGATSFREAARTELIGGST